MVFAPPVGFNLTFACPSGQVFESDWLAAPFVMMTCQVLKYFRNKSMELKKQNRYQSKLLQQAKKVNISHLVDGKLAKDSIDQEIKELKTQNSALHVKIGKMNETHGHTVNQFVDSIVSLSKFVALFVNLNV